MFDVVSHDRNEAFSDPDNLCQLHIFCVFVVDLCANY